jgi:hypothetical protein
MTFEFTISLLDPAGDIVDSPTIVAGDVQRSIDGAAYANLDNLPTVSPASGGDVRVILSDAEVNAATESIVVDFQDQTDPAEWTRVKASLTLDDLSGGFESELENGESVKQALRLIRAEAAGSIERNGLEHKIKSADGLTDRIIATASASGREVTSTDPG